MAIAILDQAVFSGTPDTTVYTFSFNTVPVGTTRLLVLVEHRGWSSGSAPPITSVTHNGDPVTSRIDNQVGGYNEINTWWGERLNPDTGTRDVVVTFAAVTRGCKCWVLAISGELASGSIFGASALKRTNATSVNTFGLGITPTSSGDSLILTSLSIAADTTLTSFTGDSFTLVETGTYSVLGDLTSTSRYRNGTSGAVTVSVVFGVSNADLGGSLVEIFSEPTAASVSGSFTTNLAMTGSVVAGLTTARLADADFRNGLSSWTEVLTIHPDAVGVDRRLITAGPAAAPNLTVDQAGTSWRWRYRLTDGQVTVVSGVGTQTPGPQHLALIHQPGNPATYVLGLPSVSSLTNQGLVGTLDIGSGGEALAGHDQPSPAAYTGLIGRYALLPYQLSPAQIRLMALAAIDPDAIWAYGEEDSDSDPNFSPLAFPLQAILAGEESRVLWPKITDPLGSELDIIAVTQPANGTLAIGSNNSLIYRPNPGWQGADFATYTASDGLGKASIGKLTLRQEAAALKANGDAISVTSGGSISFNPRANDSGSGPLVVTAVGTPSHGTAVIQSNNNVLYTPAALYTGSDSFSYTVRDNFSTATATVAVTVVSGETPFVTASDDSVITANGVAVTVSPLFNDQFSAGLGPLIVASVGSPSPSGTAAIQTNQRDIRFTPASGFVGAASFSYTARSSVNSAMQSTANVTVQVQNVVTGDYPETSINTIMPAGTSDLGQWLLGAYASAESDTTLWIRAGVYNRPGGGTWAFNKSVATAGSPIIIRPVGDNWTGPRFTNRVVISGKFHILAGIDFRNVNGHNVTISGQGSRASRCRVFHNNIATAQGFVARGPVTGIVIDRCEITIKTGYINAKGVAEGECNGLDIETTGGGNQYPIAPIFEYNYVHDSNGLTKTQAQDTNGKESLQIGEGNGSNTYNIGAIIRFCLFERCTNEGEVISLKSSNNKLTNVILRECNLSGNTASNRVGKNNTWTACVCDNIGKGYQTWHQGHTFIGCVARNGSDFDFSVGNVTTKAYDAISSGWNNTNNKPAPTDIKMYWCEGPIKIGNIFNSNYNAPVLNIEIKSHVGGTGAITYESSKHSGVTTTGTAPGSKPAIVDLIGGNVAGANVGPWASTGAAPPVEPPVEPPPPANADWWKLSIRSGRAWAGGTAYWYDRTSPTDNAAPRLAAEEADVALIDAMAGSAKGTSLANIATWDGIIGGAVGGSLDSTDTQFDWRTTTHFGFGHCINHIPSGQGWLIWVLSTIPASEATSASSSPIWDAIINGDHDAKYVKMGERIVTKMTAVGQPLERLILDCNHEMNQSNIYQIWAGTVTKYKNAMQRTINQIRKGADNISAGAGAKIHFCHRPAYRVDPGDTKVGTLDSFMPNNIDVLALSIHPDATCNTSAKVDQLFAGTLNSEWYGITELIAAANARSLPIMFPEWSPKFEPGGGGPCPVANTFVTKFYNDVLLANKDILIADCVHNQNIRDTDAYTGSDPDGIAQWSNMVATRKTLWSGIKS